MNWTRLFTAYAMAAVVAALIAGFVTFNPGVMVAVLVIVLAFELVVLLPIYLALQHRGKVNEKTVLAIGFLVGALPIAWFTWPLRYPELKGTSSSGGVMTMVDGVPTLAGWLEYGAMTALFGFFGLVAAAGFWWALGKRAATAPSDTPVDGATARSHSWWKPVAVLALIAVIVALPVVTKDRSCHNLFRDNPVYGTGGVHSARPKATLYFPALTQDWKEVAAMLVAFGRERHLEIRDLTEEDQHSKQLYVSLCNQGGTAISILDRVYSFGPPTARGEPSVSVYGMRPGSDWKQQADALEVVLRAKYGDRVRREDPPIASVSELAIRLKAVHERPRHSADELADPERLAEACKAKRVEVRHLGSIPGQETHEFEVTCDPGGHAFVVGTTVQHQDRIQFKTRKVPQLIMNAAPGATVPR